MAQAHVLESSLHGKTSIFANPVLAKNLADVAGSPSLLKRSPGSLAQAEAAVKKGGACAPAAT